MVFRTKFIGLSAAAMMFSGMAFGQTCSGTNTLALTAGLTNNIRAEGQTEALPQITLSCATTNTAASVFNVFVQVSNAPITSKITATSSNTTEATIASTGGVATSTTVSGTLAGGVLTFSNISVTPLAAGTPVTFVISNIRVNASAIPSAGAFPASVSASAFVQGTTNTTSGPIGSALTAAFVYNAISNTQKVYTTGTLLTSGVNTAGALNSTSYSVCASNNTSSTTGSAAASFFIGVQEAFAGAFKTQALETGTSASAAASGTRVKIVWNNVPTGLNIYMPTSVTSINGATITATSSELGAFSAVSAATTPAAVNTLNLFLVPVTGTTATAIYEVTTAATSFVNTFPTPVYFVAGSNTITNYLTAPTLTFTESLAPQPATAASQIPSFSSTATDIYTVNTITFKACTTTLLFPFVTNANGFETGIAISNTTKDPFSTVAQSGTCTLNYYATGVSGATNPTAVVAPNLAEGANQPFLAGETYAFTLTQSLGVSATNPATFQGYVIAQCNFVDAHAFAYILGGLQPGMFVNPNNTAMGYLALVLSRGGGSIDSSTFSVSGPVTNGTSTAVTIVGGTSN